MSKKFLSSIFSATALAAALFLAPSGGKAQQLETITENDFISGTMDIDFGTRRYFDSSGTYVDGSPAKEAKDVYKLNINVAKTTEYSGEITRHPRLVTKVLGREEQRASLTYAINLAVRNPKDLEQKKNVGKWVGTVAISPNGEYDFGTSGAGGSQLRIAVDAVGKAPAFVGNFGGKVIGKSEEKKGEVASKIKEYTRIIDTLKGKKVFTVKAKDIEPLKFVNLTLGEGPAQVYPKTVVNGNLDYDFETGNWYTDGISFKYTLNGADYEDKITGSIKWIEDPSRKSNGKGQYEFNLRFNEDKNKPATDESAAFSGGASDEEAFFAVDNSVPSMTGTVSYVDTLTPGEDEDEPTVEQSKVIYNLNANKLTKQQALNFFKLWMVIIGPTNDE